MELSLNPILGRHQTGKAEKWRFSRPLGKKLGAGLKSSKHDWIVVNVGPQAGNAATEILDSGKYKRRFVSVC